MNFFFAILLCVPILACVQAKAPSRGQASLTEFTSYPEPDSEECKKYNGCKWSGQFAFVNGKKSVDWVKANNIIAVHERDAQKYKLKTFRITQGDHSIDAKVYDKCADSDCNDCCTKNAKKYGFLIDMESFTYKRFGGHDGKVSWECLDC